MRVAPNRLPFPGTEGYAEQASELIARYESVSFLERHACVLHLLPTAPCRVLDVGAGTGSDAAWLAAAGHAAVAVEPTDALRDAGRQLHPAANIEWIADGLPELVTLRGRDAAFDLILLTAVWMHLDRPERERAMDVLSSLLAPEGLLLFSNRNGPVPPRRRMFAVPAAETIAQATARGLETVLDTATAATQAANRAAGITWTRVGFRRPGVAAGKPISKPVRVRPAQPEEHGALSALARAAKAHWGYDAADLARWNDDLRISAESIARQPTYVAEHNGQRAGFVQLSLATDAAVLEHLWVAPEHMRKGIGRLLLRCGLAVATAWGCREVRIDADPNAERFYVACGARRIGAIEAPVVGAPRRVRPQLVIPLPHA